MEAAYRRYGPALLRKARRMLQNEDDARDVVQALFVDLWQQTPRPPMELGYLYRALTRRCLNHLRDHNNRTRLLQQHSPSLRGAVRIAPDDRALGLDALIKLRERVDEAVMEVVVYRYFDELTLEEIAEVTGVTRKTVSKRLGHASDAVRALRQEAP